MKDLESHEILNHISKMIEAAENVENEKYRVFTSPDCADNVMALAKYQKARGEAEALSRAWSEISNLVNKARMS